jgi:hypothetical protein
MPIGFDPNDFAPVTLDAEAAKPADQRATFHVRFRTVREADNLDAMLDAWNAEKDPDKRRALTRDVLSFCLSGWHNVPGDFDVGRLDDLLTPTQVQELLVKCIEAPRLAEEDRKNSGSRSASAGGPPARPAA